jgi:hypothetical protein
MHVDIEDKIKMKELMPAFLNHPLNSQPHTVYINESGLYCLVIRFILYRGQILILSLHINATHHIIYIYYNLDNGNICRSVCITIG